MILVFPKTDFIGFEVYTSYCKIPRKDKNENTLPHQDKPPRKLAKIKQVERLQTFHILKVQEIRFWYYRLCVLTSVIAFLRHPW